MQLPESYWNDINRYTGEILAGLPLETEPGFFIAREVLEYGWPAQEHGVRGLLQKNTYRFFGALSVTYHDLSVRTEEKNVTSAHFIRFSPIHNKIEHVQDDTYDPSQDRTFIADAKALWSRHRFAKRLGLTSPVKRITIYCTTNFGAVRSFARTKLSLNRTRRPGRLPQKLPIRRP